MTNSLSCSHGHWCTRADALLGVEGIHVGSVTATAAGLVLRVETGCAVAWATDALEHFDTSVSALAHQLGVSWHTVWHGIRAEAARRISAAGRLKGVDALGVDEHVWAHAGPPGAGVVTAIVDHTRDAHGRFRARLLDLVPGRPGKAYADWLKERGEESTGGIKTAPLDPFRGYANVIRDELLEAITGRLPCREARLGHGR